MRRPSYKTSVQWLLDNDDCSWMDDVHDNGTVSLSVAAHLVADMFGVLPSRLVQDLGKLRDASAKAAA